MSSNILQHSITFPRMCTSLPLRIVRAGERAFTPLCSGLQMKDQRKPWSKEIAEVKNMRCVASRNWCYLLLMAFLLWLHLLKSQNISIMEGYSGQGNVILECPHNDASRVSQFISSIDAISNFIGQCMRSVVWESMSTELSVEDKMATSCATADCVVVHDVFKTTCIQAISSGTKMQRRIFKHVQI